MGRVGTPLDGGPGEAVAHYVQVGAQCAADVLSMLPTEYSFRGKRVLDFGCGSGRILRYLSEMAEETEFWGCDIDGSSIEWLNAHFGDRLRFVHNGDAPPLPLESGSFDLIYAVSVFSHLTDSWAAWLLELHRLLVPGGLLVATFHGDGLWESGIAGSRGVPFDHDRIGMHVERYGDDFSTGSGWGPAVYVSEWWLRAHWGRAFEIRRFEPRGFAFPDESDRAGQGCVVARRVDVSLSAEDLTRPAEDRRELAAALFSRDLVCQELAQVRQELAQVREHDAVARVELDDAKEIVRAHTELVATRRYRLMQALLRPLDRLRRRT